MSFPVGGSLGDGCGAPHGELEAAAQRVRVPTSLKFTPKEVSRLYGGDVTTLE